MSHAADVPKLHSVRVDELSALDQAPDSPELLSGESTDGLNTIADERDPPAPATGREHEPPNSRLVAADLRLTHRLESIVAGAGAFSSYRAGRIRSAD